MMVTESQYLKILTPFVTSLSLTISLISPKITNNTIQLSEMIVFSQIWYSYVCGSEKPMMVTEVQDSIILTILVTSEILKISQNLII